MAGMTDREYGRHARHIYEWDEVDIEDLSASITLEAAPARPVDDALVVDDQQPESLRSSISNLLKRKLF